MNLKKLVILGMVICMTGCSRSESYKDWETKEENPTLDDYSHLQTASAEEIKKSEEEGEIVDLSDYVDDKYFYEDNQNQVIYIEDNKVSISIGNAKITDSESYGGSYFENSPALDGMLEFVNNIYKDDFARYAFVDIEFTNLSGKDINFGISNFAICHKETDSKGMGSKYGYSNTYIKRVLDMIDFTDMGMSKSADFVDLKAGETFKTTMEYVVLNSWKDDLYIRCNYLKVCGDYNKTENIYEPIDNENQKYIKVNLEDQ